MSTPLSFTTTLSDADWDATKGGWRCPSLQIPGSEIKDIYVAGAAVDHKAFTVNRELQLIRWAAAARPKSAAAHVQVDKALSTEELTLRWKKFAVILPVVGSLLTGVAVAALKSSRVVEVDSTGSANAVKIFERSNDFLSSGPNSHFESALKGTRREAWFVGTTFYISFDQYHDQLLRKMQDGVDINLLILDPDGSNIQATARLLGLGENELRSSCISAIQLLDRLETETRKVGTSGKLQVKLFNSPIQSRLYFFDPKSNDGMTYYIPLMNGTNSQQMPGFLVNNSVVKIDANAFAGAQRMWNSDAAVSLADWKNTHPNLFR